ncbi:MAG: hypothetical protein ACPGXK_10540 [Phycisphaerae bacterium]
MAKPKPMESKEKNIRLDLVLCGVASVIGFVALMGILFQLFGVSLSSSTYRELRADLNQTHTELHMLVSRNAETERDLAHCRADKGEVADELTRVSAEMKEQAEALAVMTADVERAKRDAARHRTDLLHQESKNTALADRVSALEQELTLREERLASLQSSNMALERENLEVSGRLEQTQSHLAYFKSESAQLRDSLAASEATRAELTRDLDDQRHLSRLLEEELVALRTQDSQSTMRLQKIEHALSQCQIEVTSSQRQLTACVSEAAQVRDRHDKDSRLLTWYREQFDRLVDQPGKMRAVAEFCETPSTGWTFYGATKDTNTAGRRRMFDALSGKPDQIPTAGMEVTSTGWCNLWPALPQIGDVESARELSSLCASERSFGVMAPGQHARVLGVWRDALENLYVRVEILK